MNIASVCHVSHLHWAAWVCAFTLGSITIFQKFGAAVSFSDFVLFMFLILIFLDRRQRHHPGDRATEGPGPGPPEAHADFVHGRAAVPARARVPAVPIRRGSRAHWAREAAKFVRNAGKELMLTVAKTKQSSEKNTIQPILLCYLHTIIQIFWSICADGSL